MAQLTIITGPLRKQSFRLDSKDPPKILGRSKDKTDIPIPDPSVSRRHAEFSFHEGECTLRDLGSSNGTFLNERRITGPASLSNQDQIRCGGTVLLFESADVPSRRPSTREAADQMIGLVFDPGETMVAVAYTSLQSKQAAAQQRRMIEAGQAALNMSHGIKNILQALHTGIDVMDQSFRRQDFEQARKSWGILRRNFGHIEKFVLDMLQYSREDKIAPKPCQFNRLVESAVEMMRPQAAERSIALTAQLDEHLGQVKVDPDRMRDVIVNLLLNAIEAVEAQTGQVTISTERDVIAEALVVRVQDNGPGIEDVETIFRPFHSTKGRSGTGLGLPITQKIVAAHRGTIDVQSLPGEGTIFIVKLPLVPETNSQ